MTWSYGAVHEKGLILKEDDLKKLLILSDKFKKENDLSNEDIKCMTDYEIQDYDYFFDIHLVTVCDISKLVGFNSNGQGQYDLIETIENDSIYVIWLKKDNLLNCYSGLDEIIKEIEDNIVEELGVDIETIKKELGENFIIDRIGLATGFYSNR